jgi:hypothetical protein
MKSITLQQPRLALPGQKGEGIIRDGLVAWYKFDERQGQRLIDYSGYGNHGQLGSTIGSDTNDPTWNGQGLAYATDDYVAVNNPNQPLKTLQLVFYIGTAINRLSAANVPVVLSSTDQIVFGSVTGLLTDEIVTIYTTNNTGRSGWCSSSENIPVGWHVLDIYWNIDRYKFALDGIEKTTVINGVPTVVRMAIGMQLGGAPGSYFNGIQGYGLFYNETLTKTQRERNRSKIRADLTMRSVILP